MHRTFNSIWMGVTFKPNKARMSNQRGESVGSRRTSPHLFGPAFDALVLNVSDPASIGSECGARRERVSCQGERNKKGRAVIYPALGAELAAHRLHQFD